MLKRFLKDITLLDTMLARAPARETTELLRRSLDDLAAALARTRDQHASLDALIIDAAMLFDGVEDVRRYARVLDPELRPIGETLDRFLKDVMGAVADRLSMSPREEELPAAVVASIEPAVVEPTAFARPGLTSRARATSIRAGSGRASTGANRARATPPPVRLEPLRVETASDERVSPPPLPDDAFDNA